MAGEEGGRFDIQVTVGQVTEDINALSTQIESLNQLAAPATGNIKALKEALDEIKSTYSAFKGIKIDGAAIVKALPNFDKQFEDKLQNLKGISEKFKFFSDALKGINDSALQADRLAQSFSSLSSSFGQIEGFAKELKNVVEQIPLKEDPNDKKHRTGTVGDNVTVFGAFNRLLSIVNNSVNKEELAKFKSFAASMKTFSSSLQEMISTARTTRGGFDQIDVFFNQLSDPKLNNNNRNVSRLQEIVNSVAGYVDALSPKVQRKLITKQNEDGTSELQSIINAKVQGINDVADSIKKLTPVLNGLAGAQTDEAIVALGKAKEKILEFVNAFYDVGKRSTKGGEQIRDKKTGQFTSNKTPVYEILSAKVQGTKDVLGLIDTLSKDLNEMTGKKIEQGLANIETAKIKIVEFIQKLNALLTGESVEVQTNVQSSQAKQTGKFARKSVGMGTLNIKTFESTLKVDMDGVKDILNIINTLSTYLTQMSDEAISTGMNNIETAKGKIAEFIEKLSELGQRSSKGVVTRNAKGQFTSNSTIKEVIGEKVQATRDVLNTINTLSTYLTQMSDEAISTGINNIENAKNKIADFIERLSSLLQPKEKKVTGTNLSGKGKGSSKDYNVSVKTIKTVIEGDLDGVKDVLGTINTLSRYLENMSSQYIDTGIENIETAKTKIADFIEKLSGLGHRTDVSGGQKRDAKGRFTSDKNSITGVINENILGVKDTLSTINTLSNYLQQMAEQGISLGIKRLTEAKRAINNFIRELGDLGKRDSSGGDIDVNGATWSYTMKEKFNPYVEGVTDILGTIRNLGSYLEKLAGVNSGTYQLDKARESIHKFISDIGKLDEPTEGGSTDFDSSKNQKLKDSLNARIIGVQEILKLVNTLASDLHNLGDDAVINGLAALELARPALQKFIEGFDIFVSKPQSSPIGFSDPNQSNNLEKVVPILENQVNGVDKVVQVLKPLPEIISGLNLALEGRQNIEALGETLRTFIKGFSFVEEIVFGEGSYKGRKYIAQSKEQITNFENGLNNVNAIADVIKKFAPAFEVLAKNGVEGSRALSSSRANIQNFITEFERFIHGGFNIGSEKTPVKAEFNDAIKHLTDFSNAFAKYATALRVMSGVGNLDFNKMKTDMSSVVEIVKYITENADFKEIKPEDAKRFSNIGGSLRNIATFINSANKSGDFSDFTAKLQNAIPAIKQFIESMSGLVHLSAFPDFERVANALGKFDTKLKDVTNTVKTATQSWTKFKSIVRQIYTAFVGGAVIYSIVRGIKSAIKEMFDLEYAMARVNTIARVSKETLKDMTHQVQQMSASFGVESSKVSKALYDINSATIKGAASMKILQQSIVLAVAGFTDVEKVSDLIAKAVNAYEYNVNEAAKISDILFVTVERGINPMEELSEYFGRLFTVSANAGVSLEEIAAGLATLTARGYQTNVASTSLNSAILKLSTGTKELNKLFQQYGYASSASALRTVGLSGALQVLYKAAGGATDKLHDLGFNYRDIRAATTLASGAINEYNKTLAMMNDENYKAGRTLEAQAEVMDTVKFKFDQLKATFTVFIQTIAEYLDKNELIKDSLNALSEAISNVTKSMQGTELNAGERASADIVTLIPKFLTFYGILHLIPKTVRDAVIGFSLFGETAGKSSMKVAKVVDEFKGFNAPIEGAKAGVKGLTISFKTLGKTIASALKLDLIIDIINGMWGLAKAWEKIFREGTFFSGLSDLLGLGGLWKMVTGNFRDGLEEVFRTMVGNFASTFIGMPIDLFMMDSDFGFASSIRNAIKPADAKNMEGAYSPETYRPLLADFVTKGVTELKNYDFDLRGYDEAGVEAEFDRIAGEAQELATKLNVSQKIFNDYYLKPLLSQKNKLLDNIKEFEKMHPELIALRDVFSDASKEIANAFEKNMGALQKEAYSILKVQNAMGVITNETGLSQNVVKSAFASDSNFREFKFMIEEMIREGTFTPSASFNIAMTQLYTEIGKTEKGLDSFTKSIVQLGIDLNKLSTDVSLEDVVGNAFNLSGVATLKSELQALLSSPEDMLSDAELDTIIRTALVDIKAMKSFNEIYDDLKKAVPNHYISDKQLTTIFDKLKGMTKEVSDYTSQLTQLDFTKFISKMRFGGETSAFNQYMQVDSKTISNLMESDIGGASFREMLKTVEEIGIDEARRIYDESTMLLFNEYFKKLQTVFSDSPSKIQNELKNFNKKAESFVAKYRDSLLTPIQKFEKVDDELNMQLKMLEMQAEQGNVSPELLNNTLQNIEELQKLNEEVMTMKVPSAITASEAVRTGSKEAFDLVATNIFRDMYKVNVQQSNYQKDLVSKVEQLVKKSGSSLEIIAHGM